jgi:cell division protein FtsN
MADRYQERPFPTDDFDRGNESREPARDDTDPLAELARLIGQSDPFGSMGRANQQVPPRVNSRDQYQPPAQHQPPAQYQPPQSSQYQLPAEPDLDLPAGPPPWLQRASRQEIPEQDSRSDYPNPVHPLQRYPAARPPSEPDYQHRSSYPDEPTYADEPDTGSSGYDTDPTRYDDVLYGRLGGGASQSRHDEPYADDNYTYQDGYDDGEPEQLQKRRGGMATVAAVLALAVVGTGAAFAYRSYVGSPRIGDPPIIRADTSPTKVVPAPSDGTAKLPDRMASGDVAERIVPREEAPVDVNEKLGPRLVFPPLSQNGKPPSAASVTTAALPLANTGNGTLSNNEPRKVKTLTVRSDQPDGAALPVGSTPPGAKQTPASRAAAAPLPTTTRSVPLSANASASAPLSLAPQGNTPAAETRTRVADINPVQTVPTVAPSGGGYLVQVSSQRNEADAQASYRALQGKFPAVLGSHSPVIKRADLGEKGVYYRAMVGPFGTSDEASQFCGSLKSAGGQCVIQRN